MTFERISYKEKTGKNSKQIETYNFHKAASVLAEYGFDCIRISNDWRGADFLAYHPETGQTLAVQLKTCLVIDKKYLPFKDLYMCFPLDGTGNWYLIKHKELMEIAKKEAPQWFDSNRWKNQKRYWSYTGRHRRQESLREALRDFAYESKQNHVGFRKAAKRDPHAY